LKVGTTEPVARGRFITFEGGEGAGKSTQARRLAAHLEAAGQKVVLTREPGGTAGAERIRALLLDAAAAWTGLAEILLHFAARAEHVARVIRPALAAGSIVICDRFTDSTLAYQGYGQGGDRAAIAQLARLIALEPDLTIVLDISVADSLSRLAARGEKADRYERLGADFFARVAAGFRAIAAAAPERCVLIGAVDDEARIAARIADLVRARLGLGT
jgi:dTMP kinase